MRAREEGRVDTSKGPESLDLQAASSAHNHDMRAHKTLIKVWRMGKSLCKTHLQHFFVCENLFLSYSAPLTPPNYCPRPTTATQRRE
jgi:hypothetical protein